MSYNVEEMSWSDVRNLFRKWRDDNERKSEDVMQLWDAILSSKQGKLGNERHLVLEQVIIAALDCNRVETAEHCVSILSAEFPGSLRIQKYRAMLLEGLERYDDALDELEHIIRKDETNAAPRKRKVALLKAQGRTAEAIKELCEYMKIFMSDQEGWHELCNLYLAESEYAKAAFCMEELLLHNPHSHLIHQRLADIRYTMGGLDNIEMAKTHYCKAVKLNVNNLRALYGLFLCCGHITNSKAAIAKRKEAQKLAQWVMGQIQSRTELSAKDTKMTQTKSGKCGIDSNGELRALEQAFGGLDVGKLTN
ncbi:ER membrane protein complex subunit 2-like [Anopheles ziemanni]|uniref:ER membrane protein complex subunit 2-like n=1 Tax=Anopheles coustani TaxID=139045 RepID=UPI00265B64C7|nr:ER membrane protein complex subunit 2-like [Anopheles coustani]XP_058171397.1 ER membrane protein complex subunit 2-like [Anopheles ziemanni]